MTVLLTSLTSVGGILGIMVIVALIETVLPLHARGRWGRFHLGPNLALTFITFGTNMVFNALLVVTLQRLQSAGFGPLHRIGLPRLLEAIAAIVLLDFSFYLAHVAMHKIPAFWRFHRVHHSDPAVDVTTTIRQHPGESVIRYAFMAVAAVSVGVNPALFAIYRLWSAINGLFEHANIRIPRRLDSLLSLLVTTPNMHKVHHSRSAEETDSNYGNIVSLFDRLFRTFTPSLRGLNITYGLAGFDDPAKQTTAGLLVMPFVGDATPGPNDVKAGQIQGDGLATR
jgi:sterol desaturase/sphingolipid hydroxylase (fatty acid hydroxylase superfamily)